MRFIILLAIGTEAVAERRCCRVRPRVRREVALLVQGNGHGRELGKSRTRTGVNPQAKPLRAYGACSDHLSRITPRRRSLSGRTK